MSNWKEMLIGAMQERKQLADAIADAEYRVDLARDELDTAMQELEDLRNKFDATGN